MNFLGTVLGLIFAGACIGFGFALGRNLISKK